MDARAFDRDDAGLFEARDGRINVSGRTAERPVHALPLATTDTPHNLQDDQILCVLHRGEGVSLVYTRRPVEPLSSILALE